MFDKRLRLVQGVEDRSFLSLLLHIFFTECSKRHPHADQLMQLTESFCWLGSSSLMLRNESHFNDGASGSVSNLPFVLFGQV